MLFVCLQDLDHTSTFSFPTPRYHPAALLDLHLMSIRGNFACRLSRLHVVSGASLASVLELPFLKRLVVCKFSVHAWTSPGPQHLPKTSALQRRRATFSLAGFSTCPSNKHWDAEQSTAICICHAEQGCWTLLLTRKAQNTKGLPSQAFIPGFHLLAQWTFPHKNWVSVHPSKVSKSGARQLVFFFCWFPLNELRGTRL